MGLQLALLGTLIGIGAVIAISGGLLVFIGWKINAVLLGLEDYIP